MRFVRVTEYWLWFRQRAFGKTAAVFVLLIGLLVTALIWRAEGARLRTEVEAKAVEHANALAARIKQRLIAYELVLRGGAALFAATAYPSREQWRAYVEALDIDHAYPGMLGVAFAAWLQPHQVPAFETRIRDEGFPEFRVWPAGPRAEVSSIVYIEPFDAANMRAFGYDMYADPIRRQAMQLARDSGLPTLTPPVALVQDAGGAQRTGVLMYLPVYQYRASTATPRDRQAALAGWVYAPFRTADVMASLGRGGSPPLQVRLYDGQRADSRILLYADESRGDPGDWKPLLQAPIEALGRIWTLEARLPPGADPLSAVNRPWESLAGGLVVSLLLFAVVWSMATTGDRASALAESMTLALRRANEELDSRVRERTSELTAANELLRDEIARRERIEAERAASLQRERERSAQLRALADASLGISLSPDQGARLEYLADRACHILGCSYAIVVAGDDAAGDRAVTIAGSLPLSAQERRALLEAAPGWPAADRIRVVRLASLGGGEVPGPAAADDDAMMVPVQVGRGRQVGTLYLLHTGGERFGDEDQVIARQLMLMVTASMATAEAVESERRARIEAESANASKDEFLAIVSHELRTPLHAIVGWLNVIERKGTSGEHMHRAVDVIRRNAQAQGALIDDLLDLARIEQGKLAMSMARVSMDALVAATVESHRQVAAARDIALSQRIEARGDVQGDALRLQQALGNLVGNALKFTHAGGHVELRLRRDAGDFLVEVQDDGQGIEPDVLPHVFDRFRQADSSSRRRQGGLGLGLALVKHIAEAHGGRVSAASAGAGHGARFALRLPALQPAPARKVEEAPEAHEARAGVAVAPARARGLVMLIDDHDDSREALGHCLAAEGFAVVPCASVDAAIDWLAGREPMDWPAAALCDIEMPGRDGYQFVEALRGLEARGPGPRRPLPVVALTAYASAEDRDRALARGFVAHLPKPVAPDRLVELLARFTG